MRDAVDEFGQTIVMVTHDPYAAPYADRCVPRRRQRRRRSPRRRLATRSWTRWQRWGTDMIGTLARNSLRTRLGRNIFIGLAIMLGVSFVAGSFVLADSMKATFNDLFTELSENTDLVVRAELAGVDEMDGAVRDPIDRSLVDEVSAIDGVDLAEGSLGRFAQMLDPRASRSAPAAPRSSASRGAAKVR
ncbi:MAG: hypothetical protein R2697_12160 [Ilumatobacteraceae bacterium]